MNPLRSLEFNAAPMKIVLFGEVLFDQTEQEPVLGGAPLNAAACCQQLATHRSANVAVLSCVGGDDLGRRALREMEALGLSTGSIQIDPDAQTGFVKVMRQGTEQSYDILRPRAFDAIQYTAKAESLFRDADVILFGSLILRSPHNLKVFSKLLEAAPQAELWCDLNLRQGVTAEVIRWCLSRATLVKLNEQEVTSLRDDFNLPLPGDWRAFAEGLFEGRALESSRVNACVVTHGERGLSWIDRSQVLSQSGVFVSPDRFQNTIGCGDAVSGALLAARALGASLPEALELASTAGAYAAIQPGGVYQVSIERLEQVFARSLLQSRAGRDNERRAEREISP